MDSGMAETMFLCRGAEVLIRDSRELLAEFEEFRVAVEASEERHNPGFDQSEAESK